MRKPSAVWRSRSADLVSVEVEVISMFGRALFQWKATAAQSAPCLGYRRLFCHPIDPHSTDRTPRKALTSGRKLVTARLSACALGSVDRERSLPAALSATLYRRMFRSVGKREGATEL